MCHRKCPHLLRTHTGTKESREGKESGGEGQEGKKGNLGDWGGERKGDGKERDKDMYRCAGSKIRQK